MKHDDLDADGKGVAVSREKRLERLRQKMIFLTGLAFSIIILFVLFSGFLVSGVVLIISLLLLNLNEYFGTSFPEGTARKCLLVVHWFLLLVSVSSFCFLAFRVFSF